MFTDISTNNSGSAIYFSLDKPLKVTFCSFKSCTTTSDGTIFMKLGTVLCSLFNENNASKMSTIGTLQSSSLTVSLCSSYKSTHNSYTYMAGGELTNTNFTKTRCLSHGMILTAYPSIDTKFNNHYNDQPILYSASIESYGKLVTISYTNIINASIQANYAFFVIGRGTKVVINNSFFEINNLTNIVSFWFPKPNDIIIISSSVFICPINISHPNISLINVETQSDIGTFTYVDVAIYKETKFDSYIITCAIRKTYFNYLTNLYVFIYM